MSPRDIEQQDENRGSGTGAGTGAGTTGVTATTADSPDLLRATPEMCHYCFDVIVDELIPTTREKRRSIAAAMRRNSSTIDTAEGRRSQSDGSNGGHGNRDGVPHFARAIPPSTKCPLFVTWDKRKHVAPSLVSRLSTRSTSRTSSSSSLHDSRNEQQQQQQQQQLQQNHEFEFELRGCIGTLSPRPLISAVKEYALTSAFRDRRFDPIRKHELPHLRVAVSLLVNYEECSHCYDWIVGTHGIIIDFFHGTSQYSATYLPEVPLEQGWTQEEAIRSLVRKSGFRGDICEELIRRIRTTRYQSSKHRLTYQDYVKLAGSDPVDHESSSLSTPTPQLPAAALVPPAKHRGGWRQCFNL